MNETDALGALADAHAASPLCEAQARLARARRQLRRAADAKARNNALVRLEHGRVSATLAAALGAPLVRMAGQFLAFAERLAKGGAQIKRACDLAYGDGPRRRLDIYAPAGAQTLPVIVFFYGGAWRAGRKEDFRFVGLALARRGFVVVIGDQRLAPQHGFPAFLHDSASIVRWTTDTIHQFGGDRARIVLMGHSAGAYNAVMLGLDPRYLHMQGCAPGAPRGIIGLAGPYDFYPFPLQLCVDAFAAAGDPLETQPVHFARPGAPPLLLLAGAMDAHVPPENTISLATALKAAGAPCKALMLSRLTHLDMLIGLSCLGGARKSVLEQALSFAHLVSAPASGIIPAPDRHKSGPALGAQTGADAAQNLARGAG